MGSATGITNQLVGGWGIDGVTTFQRGFPVKISYGAGTPLSAAGLGIGTLRPNVVQGCDKGKSDPTLHIWFNPTCFTAPAAWSFGDEARVDPTLRQDGIANWDFAAFKSFMFTERINLQFRAEFFNLFNSPTFGPPNGTCCFANNSNFGVVTSTVGNPRLIQFGLKLSF
jgi:hypothetical protein